MIELMIAVYGTILWLVFKKFKLIPINQWTVVTSILIGVGIIGFVLLMMNMYQPVSPDGRFYAYTTPITPQVRGRVVEVPVRPNEPLKAGDILFKIDPEPYQNKVDALAAQLKLARTQLEKEQRLLRQGAGNQYEVDRLAADFGRLTAQKADAQFNLENTIVRAPTDGLVTQLTLRPGMMAVPLPLAPVMVFVHADKPIFGATFKQNVLQAVEPGDDVEIAFIAVPGRVFKGKVNRILPALGEGQFAPSGQLRRFTVPSPPGRVPVVIDVTDDISGYNLPIGTAAKVAIYTGRYKPFEIVRRVILRIQSWENYVFLP